MGHASPSVHEHCGERIGGEQAPEIAVDRFRCRCLQACLVFCTDRLEFEDEQAAQRGDAAFLTTFLQAFLDPFLDAFLENGLCADAFGSPELNAEAPRLEEAFR
jgi:hypothetical protein